MQIQVSKFTLAFIRADYRSERNLKQREEPVQAVMSEHMSVHASLVMMRSVKLNLESIDMIKLSLI